jgi:hypothetical protein
MREEAFDARAERDGLSDFLSDERASHERLRRRSGSLCVISSRFIARLVSSPIVVARSERGALHAQVSRSSPWLACRRRDLAAESLPIACRVAFPAAFLARSRAVSMISICSAEVPFL